MKKLFLSIAVLSALSFSAVAQNAKSSAQPEQIALTPDQKSDRELAKVSAQLNLNDGQKVKFKQFSLDKINANQALREKAKGADAITKQSLKTQAKSNRDKFFANVSGILSPEQQTKWAEFKKKQEQAKEGDHNHTD
jgi:protein CpxP